jgi:hypothetical protein
LHTPRHVRVVAVTVTSGRKVLRRARGHSLRNVTVKRPKGKRFTITITTTFSNGVKIRSTRTYDGCKRGKVRSKIVRRARRR